MVYQIKFNIDQPTQKFSNHLNVPFNDRIIFSGPFGTGKTFFLEKYFDGNPNYNVIHLFPVNYSVASNEDIFELIKYDILLELMKKDITFDKTNVPYLKTLFKYSLKNLHQLIAPIAYAVPYLGKEAYEMYDKYQKLSIEYFKEHDDQQVDVEKEVHDYISNSKEIKGSLIESDYYTNLVCNFVNQLKIQLSEDKKCETVLIIDDLDRIDPDHIFRILNVLSAHMDVKGEVGNKFNFDKIILVFDQQNVHKIFQNRYGSNVDFSGYIDKFYSYRIFEFENNKSLSERIIEILKTIQRPDNNDYLNIHTDQSLFSQNIYYILKALIQSNQLTIRRLFKIMNKPFSRVRHIPSLGGNSLYSNLNLEIFYILEFLRHIYGSLEEVNLAVDKCREFEDHEVDKGMSQRFASFTIVLLDADNHRFNPNLRDVGYKHFDSNQFFKYNTQNWHDDHSSFLCNVQTIETIDPTAPGRIIEDIQYFKLLSSCIQMSIDINLVRLPHLF